ncbi:MAG: hypothetical protein AAFP19_14525 [Bacteroidota bacterium]
MKKGFCLLSLLLFFSLACQNNASNNTEDSSAGTAAPSAPSATADYDVLAREFCKCAKPSIDLNTQMQKMNEEGKREEFAQLAKEVGNKFRESLSCCQEVKDAHTTASIEADRLLSKIRTVCPEIPDRFSMQLSEKIK